MARFLWLLAGLGCVGLGGLGVVVPGLPSTIFFIGAAACFTRSSPRLEQWVLGLPGVGQMVRDHRAGLGMPRRAKFAAIASITGFSALAIAVASRPAVSIGIGVLAAIGIAVVAWHVPTREHVIEAGQGGRQW
ncbi:YbaN family protein [Acidimicrobiia bacterium EGI L10123]|uniref:YbaN family protein n=1 Tax=Salinilacustrithrix flava TaxID=2957203 RepID=UPI003D7C3441|nr:YbaN family protein [Acidimicrobiia bacterium EGI L10123]